MSKRWLDGRDGQAKLALALLGVLSAACATHRMGEGNDGATQPPAACVDGAIEQAACDVLGSQSRQCTLGQWGEYSACNDPPFLVIPVPRPFDMVYDAKRHRLYITSGDLDGLVLSYDLITHRFDAPLLSGGSFLGIDLSPDGDQLIVADETTDESHNWIYRIDLTTNTSRKINFSLYSYEAGTFTAVFTSNTEVLVTSEFNGSGSVPLRKVNLATDSAEAIRTVRQGTMLTPSADDSVVAYAEAGISNGPWGRYDIGGQSFAASQTNTEIDTIAVSRTASQFAIQTRAQLSFFDRDLALQTTLGGSGGQVTVGAVYSSVADEIYLAWWGASTSIDVYSSTSLQKLRDIAPSPGLFTGSMSFSFADGRMRVSRDGRMLFVITKAGVAVYPTGL